MWDVDEEAFVDLGLSYAVRPRWFGTESARPFAYLGITNLFGMSHTLADADALSWGLGAATETVNPVHLRWSVPWHPLRPLHRPGFQSFYLFWTAAWPR